MQILRSDWLPGLAYLARWGFLALVLHILLLQTAKSFIDKAYWVKMAV